MPRLAVLDGWRGAAILSVLFAHFIISRPINLGRFGVELFFVLSGRLMAEILFQRHAALPRFYARRFARIYPAMAIFVLAAWGLSLVVAKFSVDWRAALSALTFTYNYYAQIAGHVPELSHIWSLCIEEHVYAILGLIALASRRFPIRPLTVVVVLAILAILNGWVSTLLFHGDYYAVYWRTDTRGASILLGAAGWLLASGRLKPVLEARAPAICLVAGIAAFLLNFNIVPDVVKYSLGTALLALSLATVDAMPEFVGAFLRSRLFVAAGFASFSLYLWQQLFVKLAWSIPSRLALLAPAVAVGVMSYMLIEKPARRYLNGLIDRSVRRATAEIGSESAVRLG
jgi:peptidoglycan/LPS O-acetylase OafA/YrhL